MKCLYIVVRCVKARNRHDLPNNFSNSSLTATTVRSPKKENRCRRCVYISQFRYSISFSSTEDLYVEQSVTCEFDRLLACILTSLIMIPSGYQIPLSFKGHREELTTKGMRYKDEASALLLSFSATPPQQAESMNSRTPTYRSSTLVADSAHVHIYCFDLKDHRRSGTLQNHNPM